MKNGFYFLGLCICLCLWASCSSMEEVRDYNESCKKESNKTSSGMAKIQINPRSSLLLRNIFNHGANLTHIVICNQT